MAFLLTDDPCFFPDPSYAEDDGLLAVGGDLSPERLSIAYSYGIFPWSDFRREELLWWCPRQRFVIFPDEIHVSHSMKQLIKKGTYHATFNQAFDDVIRQCSIVEGRVNQKGAWLGDEMIKAYTAMHDLGLAVSVEVWADEEETNLVGGLYGINIGKNFFGESMFSLAPNASKFALIQLAEVMKPYNGLIDCQFETSHLKSMGGRYITYEEYMEYLNDNSHEYDVQD